SILGFLAMGLLRCWSSPRYRVVASSRIGSCLVKCRNSTLTPVSHRNSTLTPVSPSWLHKAQPQYQRHKSHKQYRKRQHEADLEVVAPRDPDVLACQYM